MDKFALAHASGADWMSTAEQCLAKLKRPKRRTGYKQLGLLYLTDNLATDTQDVLAFLRLRTGVHDWVGSVGMGICATGREYFDEPALATTTFYCACQKRLLSPLFNLSLISYIVLLISLI